jgi:hypothetical protein
MKPFRQKKRFFLARGIWSLLGGSLLGGSLLGGSLLGGSLPTGQDLYPISGDKRSITSELALLRN